MDSNLTAKLLDAFLEGYAWGTAAKGLGAPVRMEDLPKLAQAGINPDLAAELKRIFFEGEAGAGQMELLDAFVDKHPALAETREYLADLLALHLISNTEFDEETDEEEDEEDLEDDDVDPRWASLELLFETRGTEMLHLLSYLRECKQTDVDPTLDDFLENFVLDEESEDQDDIFVYEELIKQSELVDGTLKQIMQVGNGQRDENMRELFTPLMLFFREREIVPGMLALAILNQSALPAIHSAIFRTLNVYWATPIEDQASLN